MLPFDRTTEERKTMTTNKKLSLVTGVLFILATVMGILDAGMVGPLFASETYLTDMASNEGLVRMSVLFALIMAGAVVAISVVLYPLFKQTSEPLAIGYLAARTIEGIALAAGAIIWLALIPLGTDYVAAGAPDGTHFLSLGDMLVSSSTSAFTLGAEIAFGISALILNTLFLRTKLVPLVISVWGLVGGALILILGMMKVLGMPVNFVEIAFTAPIALNEMVLAIWLIVKGFNVTITS